MQDFDTIRSSGARASAIDAGLRAYMNRVYALMGLAMVISGAVAFVVGNTPSLMAAVFGGPQMYLVMFAPLIMVFAFNAVMNRASAATTQLFFWAFAAVMGLSLSTIFIRFTDTSIVTAFLTTAIAFGGLSVYGYTTKRNLSALGGFFMMAVIGCIVAGIVNFIFLGSSALAFGINVVVLLAFAGLTAYDTQRLKTDYIDMARYGADAEVMGKSAIAGALSLYLDFINMFMAMLSLFGERE